ncbi:hypothetical protein MUTS7_01640 (plasmid) [Escherichia coli]|nr:hypothetical protein MUTS7_01640 [Escherichia coli]
MGRWWRYKWITFHPSLTLRKVAKPVEEVNAEIQRIVDDMFETMYAEKGIGLAATQVDIHQRIIVIDVSENRDERLVLINPELLEKSGETGIEEGCLSIPEQRALVPRAEKVKIRALDRDGKPFELEADGLLAICIGLRLGNGKYCTLRLFFNQV